MSAGPVSGAPTGVTCGAAALPETRHRWTTWFAPAAAMTDPSGLKAAVYSGCVALAATSVPTATGRPGLATFQSRSDPSAPAATSSWWSGLTLTHWTMPAESRMRATDGVSEASMRAAVACGVWATPYAAAASCAAAAGSILLVCAAMNAIARELASLPPAMA